jgi:hypothetical protein
VLDAATRLLGDRRRFDAFCSGRGSNTKTARRELKFRDSAWRAPNVASLRADRYTGRPEDFQI